MTNKVDSNSLETTLERRVHDFFDYLDESHETPRRILRHLNHSIACNDIGATAFCLQALFEGFSNAHDWVAPRRAEIEKFLPEFELNAKGVEETAKDELRKYEKPTQELRSWLLSILSDLSIGVGIELKELKRAPFKEKNLIITCKLNMLEIIETENKETWLKVPNYDVIIDPYYRRHGDVKLHKYLAPTASSTGEPNSRIDKELLVKEDRTVCIRILTTGKTIGATTPVARLKEIKGTNYAYCWINNSPGTRPDPMLRPIQDLPIPQELMDKCNTILSHLRIARNYYAHDFQRLSEFPKASASVLAFEYFEVFEPIFKELIESRIIYPESE